MTKNLQTQVLGLLSMFNIWDYSEYRTLSSMFSVYRLRNRVHHFSSHECLKTDVLFFRRSSKKVIACVAVFSVSS